jgi:hypothetical protein
MVDPSRPLVVRRMAVMRRCSADSLQGLKKTLWRWRSCETLSKFAGVGQRIAALPRCVDRDWDGVEAHGGQISCRRGRGAAAGAEEAGPVARSRGSGSSAGGAADSGGVDERAHRRRLRGAPEPASAKALRYKHSSDWFWSVSLLPKRVYLGRAWTMPKAKCCRMG